MNDVAPLEFFLQLVTRSCLLFVTLGLIFIPIEDAIGSEPSVNRSTKQWYEGVFFFFSTSFTSALCVTPLAALLFTLQSNDPALGVLSSLGAPKFTETFVLLFLGDGIAYFLHRGLHHFPSGWNIHEEHHKERETDWLSATRQHPFDQILLALAFTLPIVLLAPSWQTTAALALLLKFHSTLSHSRVPWTFGPLYWVIVSPAYHQRHHLEDGVRARNFAHIFPVFDLVFSTTDTRTKVALRKYSSSNTRKSPLTRSNQI